MKNPLRAIALIAVTAIVVLTPGFAGATDTDEDTSAQSIEVTAPTFTDPTCEAEGFYEGGDTPGYSLTEDFDGDKLTLTAVLDRPGVDEFASTEEQTVFTHTFVSPKNCDDVPVDEEPTPDVVQPDRSQPVERGVLPNAGSPSNLWLIAGGFLLAGGILIRRAYRSTPGRH